MPEIMHHKVMTELVKKFPVPKELIGMRLFPTTPKSMIMGITSQWDVLKRGRNMAGYVAPDSPANIAKRMVKENKTFTMACKKEKKQLKGSTLAWFAAPGTENQQYGEQAVRDELEELVRMIQFRNEWENWQAIQGSLAVNQEKVKFTIDYGIDASHKPDAAASWSNTNTDIVSDLKAWKKKIAEDSGEVAIIVYCNEDVMTAMIKNNSIKALMGEQLKTQILESGYIVKVCGLTFVVYDAGYVPDGGSFTPFVPQDKIVMTTDNTFGERQVGASTDPKAGFKPGLFSKTWDKEDPAGTWALVEENSLPVLKKVENVLSAKVIL